MNDGDFNGNDFPGRNLSAAIRLRRGPKPLSDARLMRWARALYGAYDNRRHESRLIDGKIVKRPAIEFKQLLERIERLAVAERARSGCDERVFSEIRRAFGDDALCLASIKSDILCAAEGGDMTPSQAERWAEAFGLPRLAGWADPEAFDPMAETFWTLPMAAAWIRWHADETADSVRLVDKVRKRWPKCIAASTQWLKVEHESIASGDDAYATPEAAILGRIIGPREDRGWSDPPDEVTDTKKRLLGALESGQLRAKRHDGNRFVDIPSTEWRALRIVGRYDEDGVHSVIAPDGSEYQAVCVRSCPMPWCSLLA